MGLMVSTREKIVWWLAGSDQQFWIGGATADWVMVANRMRVGADQIIRSGQPKTRD